MLFVELSAMLLVKRVMLRPKNSYARDHYATTKICGPQRMATPTANVTMLASGWCGEVGRYCLVEVLNVFMRRFE
jgi:hypothetical protein